MSKLADRLRGILKPTGVTDSRVVSGFRLREPMPSHTLRRTAVASAEAVRRTHPNAALEDVLGGEWRQEGDATCFVIERRVAPQTLYGRVAVGEVAGRFEAAVSEAYLLAGGVPARPPFVFFDLETTGLSGGAGTYAFLVGFGWFDEEGGFLTRQYLLLRVAGERPLLTLVAGELARAGALVSFNGKSFDAPVLETRYLFHRLEWIGTRLPHLDILHPARRFWRTCESCSLGVLEHQVLGARRVGDVAGFEIPARYFEFMRSGDARPLGAVLEHNRLDLLSLAGLTARLLHLIQSGPDHARDACEALALGHVYTRAGRDGRARDAFVRAAGPVPGTNPLHGRASNAPVRIDALRALALSWRRARHYEQAADCWRQLLDMHECPRHIACEATEALAVHHEHRVRDLAVAKAFALRSLDDGHRAEWNQAVRHRIARIERKLGTSHSPTERLQLDD